MPSPNRFFTNRPGGALHHAPEYGLDLETSLQGSNTTSVGDLDKDGWQDLLLITPNGLRVYHNEQGMGFTEVAASVGLDQSPRDVTLADVNGDSWVDVIEVEPNKLSVFVKANGKFSSVFSAAQQYGYSVATGDVNGDNRPDVYVMRGQDTAGTNAPDQVYLNDGDGASFTQMSSIPSTSQGEADSVAPIDYDGSGLTDFLVLNGGGEEGSLAGPVELIAFFRSTTPTDTTSPGVESTVPGTNATGAAPTADVTATFSEDMLASSITGQTFKLFKKGSTTQIAATVSYPDPNGPAYTAKLDPSISLKRGATYKAVVTAGAKDLARNPLEQQYRWFFMIR
jgi:Bacterial Ig-like domain/FG-GAP-like repeat/FG-GAP repeat